VKSRLAWFVGATIAVGAAAALGYGVWHHVTGPRFSVVVRPRAPMTVAECVAEVRGFGGGTTQFCESAGSAAAYVATVTNTGGRGAWVELCGVDPIDPSGRLMEKFAGTELPMWITSPGVGARPYVAPGQTVTLDWFVKGLKPTRVVRYTGSCGYVIYDTPPI
jgi:hypothetical protein